MKTIYIFGDVHGNGRALRAALRQARHRGCDHIVFLGDLLTYGHDVGEVIDLVAEAQAREGAELIIGNHDRMYFDLAAGKREYLERLPDFIRESVALTLTHSRVGDLAALKWSAEVHLDDKATAGHGNPFAPEDWRYLNSAADHLEAAAHLEARGLDVGVYGHTHRPRWYLEGSPDALVRPQLDLPMHARRTRPIVINAGAVGQPRDQSGEAVLLRLTLTADTCEATFEAVPYDREEHVRALAQIGLSAPTVTQLSRFFQL